VWGFAIVVAVNQIGVAEALVNTLLMATAGAIALAFGLAFCLGGRDEAAKISEAAPKIKQAAEVAKTDAEEQMRQQPGRPPMHSI